MGDGVKQILNRIKNLFKIGNETNKTTYLAKGQKVIINTPILDNQGSTQKDESQDELTENQQKIIGIVEKRSIRNLVHFTMVDNLESILRHGLLPISVIE